jgi:hypothetical protein
MKTQVRPLLSALALMFLLSVTNLASAYYDPGAQRWLNRDPLGDQGFVTRQPYPSSFALAPIAERKEGPNLYDFVWNSPGNYSDRYGLEGGFEYPPGGGMKPPPIDPRTLCKNAAKACRAACWAAAAVGASLTCPESGPGAVACAALWVAAASVCSDACPP